MALLEVGIDPSQAVEGAKQASAAAKQIFDVFNKVANSSQTVQDSVDSAGISFSKFSAVAGIMSKAFGAVNSDTGSFAGTIAKLSGQLLDVTGAGDKAGVSMSMIGKIVQTAISPVDSMRESLLQMGNQAAKTFMIFIQPLNMMKATMSAVNSVAIGFFKAFQAVSQVVSNVSQVIQSGLAIWSAFYGLLNTIYGIVKSVIEVFVGMGKAIYDSLTGSFDMAANFERAMANVKSMGVESEAAFQGMRAAALQLGVDTSLSASQAADALYSLRSAGFSSEEAVAALAGTARLAEATMAPLGRTAESVASTIRMFGLAASDAGNVSNVFGAAVQNSAMTMDRISGAMVYAGTVAGSLGYSLEETTAALMALNNAGITGEQSGTALRGALTSILNASDGAEQALNRLGLTAQSASQGQKDLAASIPFTGSALNALGISLDTATAGTKALTAGGMSTTEAFKSFESVMLALRDPSAKMVESLTAMNIPTTAVANNTFNLTKALDGMVEKGTITKAAYDEMTTTIKGFGVDVAAVNPNVLDLSRTLESFAARGVITAKAADALKQSVSETNGELAAVNPTVVGAGAALDALATAGLTTTQAVELLGPKLGPALAALVAQGSEGLRGMSAELGATTTNLKSINPSVTSLSDIVRALGDAGATTTDLIRIFGVESGPAMAALLKTGADQLDEFKEKITGTDAATKMAVTQLQSYNGATTILAGSIESLRIIVGDAFLPAMTRAVGIITEVVNASSKWLEETGIMKAGQEALNAIMDSAVKIGNRYLEAMKGLSEPIYGVGEAIAEALFMFADWVREVTDTVLASKEFEKILEEVSTTVNTIAPILMGATESFVSFAAAMFDTNKDSEVFGRSLRAMFELLASGKDSIIQTVTSIGALSEKLTAFFSDANSVNTIFNQLATGFEWAKTTATAFLVVFSDIARQIPTALEKIGEGIDVGKNLVKAINDMVGPVTSVIKTAVGAIETIFIMQLSLMIASVGMSLFTGASKFLLAQSLVKYFVATNTQVAAAWGATGAVGKLFTGSIVTGIATAMKAVGGILLAGALGYAVGMGLEAFFSLIWTKFAPQFMQDAMSKFTTWSYTAIDGVFSKISSYLGGKQTALAESIAKDTENKDHLNKLWKEKTGISMDERKTATGKYLVDKARTSGLGDSPTQRAAIGRDPDYGTTTSYTPDTDAGDFAVSRTTYDAASAMAGDDTRGLTVKRYTKDYYDYGDETASSYISGFSDGLSGFDSAVSSSIVVPSLETNSPPKSGPLSNVVKWGQGAASAYVGSFVETLGGLDAKVPGALGGVEGSINGALSGVVKSPFSGSASAGLGGQTARGALTSKAVEPVMVPFEVEPAATISEKISMNVSAALGAAPALSADAEAWNRKIMNSMLPTAAQFNTGIYQAMEKGLDPANSAGGLDKIAKNMGSILASQLKAAGTQGAADAFSPEQVQTIWANISKAFSMSGINVSSILLKQGENETAAQDWASSGGALSSSFMAGAAKTLGDKKPELLAALGSVFSLIEAHSPPKEGPLMNIDKWGAGLSEAFIASFVGSMTNTGIEQVNGAISHLATTAKGTMDGYMQMINRAALPTGPGGVIDISSMKKQMPEGGNLLTDKWNNMSQGRIVTGGREEEGGSSTTNNSATTNKTYNLNLNVNNADTRSMASLLTSELRKRG